MTKNEAAEVLKNYREVNEGILEAIECKTENEKRLAFNTLQRVRALDMAISELGSKASGKSIKIKYHADIDHVEKIHKGDWIDLRAAEDVLIKDGQFRMVSLGVSMQLPEGYEALVVPRSSTFRKYGVILVNSMGIIDESYCGDNDVWQFLAFAVNGDTLIPKNERICQFRIIEHQPQIEFEEVEELGNKDRGGIGSTGRV